MISPVLPLRPLALPEPVIPARPIRVEGIRAIQEGQGQAGLSQSPEQGQESKPYEPGSLLGELYA